MGVTHKYCPGTYEHTLCVCAAVEEVAGLRTAIEEDGDQVIVFKVLERQEPEPPPGTPASLEPEPTSGMVGVFPPVEFLNKMLRDRGEEGVAAQRSGVYLLEGRGRIVTSLNSTKVCHSSKMRQLLQLGHFDMRKP